MAKTVKLDLHTHPIEALRDTMGIKGIGNINIRVAEAIVKAVKVAGLNGIAITEHSNFNHGWVASLEIFDHFRKENLIILPGTELDYGKQQYLQIFVPDYWRRRIPFFQGKEWFLILAHPGHYNPLDFDEINKVKFDAVEEKSIRGEFPIAQQIAAERNIPITQASDAHKLEDIGRAYMELELK
jgi:histidinol phosphatase-like PHP family hydrolase